MTIEGISISGGDPLEQADAIFKLLTRIRQETTLSSLLFTGYTYDEILANPVHSAILPLIDVLIAGLYDATPVVHPPRFQKPANPSAH